MIEELIHPKKIIIDTQQRVVRPFTRKKEVRLSELKEYFFDIDETMRILSKGENPLVYEYYEYSLSESRGNLNIGLTTIFPGKIGKEFYMTKGHFHEKEAAELYYCIRGQGVLLMQTADGEVSHIDLEPGSVGYVPVGWGHRTINTGDDELLFFFAYPSDAGHDYAVVKERGFAKIVIKENDRVMFVENPRFKRLNSSTHH